VEKKNKAKGCAPQMVEFAFFGLFVFSQNFAQKNGLILQSGVVTMVTAALYK
jgi:hypothetical protein